VQNFINSLKNNARVRNDISKYAGKSMGMLVWLFRLAVLVGISYVILGPFIGIVARSFFSDADLFNPMVYLIPREATTERYALAVIRLDYWNVLLKSLGYTLALMVIQVIICSMVGYGFARFEFPLKKVLFACVIIMIVLPLHSIMLPLYTTFQRFDPLGLATLINGSPVNLLQSPYPAVIMTVFGSGLRSGLYIYIFTQFFRGLPKELEDSAMVDGAGIFYTYSRIMLVNAAPAAVTVSIFSLVWQYNDTFFANLFVMNTDSVISKKISTLQATIMNLDQIRSPAIAGLYTYAGIVLVIIPIILLYILLQRWFVEGVERSGIVG
jgi:multiple sugar transport system permease protein